MKSRVADVASADEKNPRRNSEGYPDPTAFLAIDKIQKERYESEKRLNQLIITLRNTIELADFELLRRIELKDKRTGRCYY